MDEGVTRVLRLRHTDFALGKHSVLCSYVTRQFFDQIKNKNSINYDCNSPK